jgi:hypothetical protein
LYLRLLHNHNIGLKNFKHCLRIVRDVAGDQRCQQNILQMTGPDATADSQMDSC